VAGKQFLKWRMANGACAIFWWEGILANDENVGEWFTILATKELNILESIMCHLPMKIKSLKSRSNTQLQIKLKNTTKNK